tara:strand:+ start:41 stop:391 length:351 start_codon:yes stop_codon:yes gene_type:complete
MKKLFFLLAFAFIGTQAYSQMYIVTLSAAGANHTCNTGQGSTVLSIIEPNGTISYVCLDNISISYNSDVLGVINQELNSIINQGYKMIETNNGAGGNGLISDNIINWGTTWYFAIP